MDDSRKTTIQELEAAIAQRALGPQFTLEQLEKVYQMMLSGKPNDRSEQDRCWAIAITDMQKLVAFFKVYVAKA